MNELEVFYKLKEAYEASTPNNNRFGAVLNSLSWDDKFIADGEHYFIKGSFIFTTPSTDPFLIDQNWKPSATFSDRSEISF